MAEQKREDGVVALAFEALAVGNRKQFPCLLLRRARGYTQVELADYLGIDRSFISDVERGKKAMTLTYLETVAQGFNITVSELVRDL